MGTGPAWPAARGPPLFRLRTPSADAGPDGLPDRHHPRADQVSELIRARHAGAWAAFADRRAAGEAAVGACDRRGGISASAWRPHRRCRRQAARMIGGEWKRRVYLNYVSRIGWHRISPSSLLAQKSAAVLFNHFNALR